MSSNLWKSGTLRLFRSREATNGSQSNSIVMKLRVAWHRSCQLIRCSCMLRALSTKRRPANYSCGESAIAETFGHFDKLDIVVVGIGAIVPEVASMLIGSGYVSSTELKSLKRAGAVGDVFSYFINDRGEIVQTEIYDHSITIGIRHIRKVPVTVGIATGAEKSRAVAAAIRGGFVNTLIVDSLLAEALLKASRSSRAVGSLWGAEE